MEFQGRNYLFSPTTHTNKRVQHLSVEQHFIILEGFNSSSSAKEDVREATDDEELLFEPFLNLII